MDNKGKQPPRQESYIMASPDPKWGDAIDRASFGSTPIHKLEIFARTLADITISKARGVLPSSVDLGITTIAEDVSKPIAYVLSGDFGKPGDQQYSEEFKHRLKEYLDGGDRKPSAHGFFDITMAYGWKPEGQIKVNGKMTVLDKPIDNMLAVFVRSPEGDVEILDPSLKVHGVGDFLLKYPVLPSLLDENSETDRKWADTAGIFIETQVLPMVLSGGGAFALRAISASGKSGALVNAAQMTAKAAQIGGNVQIASVAGQMGSELYMRRVSDQTADRLADKLVDAIKNPKSITSAVISDALNDGLHSYTFKRDLNNHIYIPSLRDSQSPWDRFSQVLQGRVGGFTKPNNPWDEWKKDRNISVPDISERMSRNHEFMGLYYKTAEKLLTGAKVTDSEYLVLRVGLSVVSKAGYDVAGKNFSSGKIVYTPEERQKTLESIRMNFAHDLLVDMDAHKGVAKAIGADPSKFKDPDYVDGLLEQFITSPPDDKHLAQYAKEARLEIERTAGDSRAMSPKDAALYSGMMMAP